MKTKLKKVPARKPIAKSKAKSDGVVQPFSNTLIRFKNGPGPMLTLKSKNQGIDLRMTNGGAISPEVEYGFCMAMDPSAPHSSVDLDVKAYFGWIVLGGDGEHHLEHSATPVDDFFYQNTGYYDGNETIPLTRGSSYYTDRSFMLKAETFENEEQPSTLLLILGHKLVGGTTYHGGIMYTVVVPEAFSASNKNKPVKSVRKKAAK